MVEVKLNDGIVVVEFSFYKGFAGNREEPPEPPSVEITKVMFKNMDITEVMGSEDLSAVEQEVFAYLKVQAQDAANDAAEAAYELHRDREY